MKRRAIEEEHDFVQSALDAKRPRPAERFERDVFRPSLERKGVHPEVALWLSVHQRYAVRDSERMTKIEERLRRLERSGWRRLWRWFR